MSSAIKLLFWGVSQPFRVRGCPLTLVERMDEEFTKIMQNTDPHSQGDKLKIDSICIRNLGEVTKYLMEYLLDHNVCLAL